MLLWCSRANILPHFSLVKKIKCQNREARKLRSKRKTLKHSPFAAAEWWLCVCLTSSWKFVRFLKLVDAKKKLMFPLLAGAEVLLSLSWYKTKKLKQRAIWRVLMWLYEEFHNEVSRSLSALRSSSRVSELKLIFPNSPPGMNYEYGKMKTRKCGRSRRENLKVKLARLPTRARKIAHLSLQDSFFFLSGLSTTSFSADFQVTSTINLDLCKSQVNWHGAVTNSPLPLKMLQFQAKKTYSWRWQLTIAKCSSTSWRVQRDT